MSSHVLVTLAENKATAVWQDITQLHIEEASKTSAVDPRPSYQQMLRLGSAELGWVESIRRLTPETMRARIMTLFVDSEIQGGQHRISRAVLLKLLLDVLDDLIDLGRDLDVEEKVVQKLVRKLERIRTSGDD